MSSLTDSVYFLELFSGNATISSTVASICGLRSVTIDMDSSHNPDICMDLTEWDEQAADLVRELAGSPDRRPIIWASPPCTEYSRLKAIRNQDRDLEQADRCVAVVEQIAKDLDVLVLLIENPATGLLKSRSIIEFMPHRYEVHYCQYGFDWMKPTFIWSSIDLPSFQPKSCPDYPECQAMCKPSVVDTPRHIGSVTHAPYIQRIAVPNQLVNVLMRAVLEELPRLRSDAGPRQERSRDSYEVNYISKARVEGGLLWLKVHWVGYDEPSYISSADLEGDLESYDFRSETLKQQIMAAHSRLEQLSKKRRRITM